MKKYNINNYYYLSNNKVIDEKDINEGATKFYDRWICNFNESKSIDINKNNKISIYIPSTIDVDKINKNFKDTVDNIKQKINENTEEYNTVGAWKTEKGNIVYENITILTINADEKEFKQKLEKFLKLAEDLKIELTQEGISVGVNDGLIIV